MERNTKPVKWEILTSLSAIFDSGDVTWPMWLIWLQWYARSDWLFSCNDWALLAKCPRHTVTSRNVRKKCTCDSPERKYANDQYTVPSDCSYRTYFCYFPLALANMYPRPPVPFFQTSLKNSALKANHNCRVHFFRHAFLEIAVYNLYLPRFSQTCEL